MFEYLSEANFRFGLIGVAAGVLAVVLVDAITRRSGSGIERIAGLVLGVFGTGLAFWLVNLLDRPLIIPTRQLQWAAVAGVVAGLGHVRLERRTTSPTVPTWLLLAACGGVWLGVPENRPALVMVGVILGTVLAGGRRYAGTGFGHSLGIAWAVALGYVYADVRFLGALTALAPLAMVLLVGWIPPPRFARRAMPALVVLAGLCGFAAARWIGVAPDATMARVWIVAGVTAIGVVAISDR